jgi:hypothetical protein
MRDDPVAFAMPKIGEKLSAWLGIGPTCEEIEEVAHDLILRHGGHTTTQFTCQMLHCLLALRGTPNCIGLRRTELSSRSR